MTSVKRTLSSTNEKVEKNETGLELQFNSHVPIRVIIKQA